MSARPLVSVVSSKTGHATEKQLELPRVFTAPIRSDVVQRVHAAVAKNSRQPNGVSPHAGHQTSAESWGTGRAVSRAPRVGGGGTHRSGQVARVNFARGGRMFAPKRTWRKWHVKVDQRQKRHAVASALAASAVPALVMARGHRIGKVPEVPLVLSGECEALRKTREAVQALRACGAHPDVAHAAASKKYRAGKGKMRGRRYSMRRGPLIIYGTQGGGGGGGDDDDAEDDSGEAAKRKGAKGADTLERAFRNLPGVEVCHVRNLNVLQLAPGGHLGRFCVWTEPAFAKLDEVYAAKRRYKLQRPVMTNADVSRIINSDEVQSVLQPIKPQQRRPGRKPNPLRNRAAMRALNPAKDAIAKKEQEQVASRPSDKRATKRKGKEFMRKMLATE